MEARKQPGHIYLVISEEQGLGKIGYCSTDPEQRLFSMQTGNPSPLSLVRHIVGTRAQEGIIHSELAAYRHAGEWFRDLDMLRILFDILYSDSMSDDDELEMMTNEDLRKSIRDALEEAMYGAA